MQADDHEPFLAAPDRHRGWSGLPVAASLALVAFAVLFGIYGPRVVDRSNPPVGIPVWDLAQAVQDRHRERVRLAETSGERGYEGDSIAAAAEILGKPVEVPDLSGIGFEPYAPRAISLPGGARALLLLYARPQRIHRSFLSIAILPDKEQFLVYSPFGKPLVLPVGELFSVDPPHGGFADVPSLVWTDGDLVRILHTLDPTALEEAEALLLSTSAASSR
jgi:hypothetical protein